MDDIKSIVYTVLIFLVISFLLFLILRAFYCWYWKINKRISLLEEQNSILKEILEKIK